MTREEVLVDIEAGCPRFREWAIGQEGSYDYGRPDACALLDNSSQRPAQ